MNRVQGLLVILPVVFAFGCQESSGGGSAAAGSASAAASAAASASAPAAPKAHASFGRHGGIGSALFHASNELPLTDEQKASVDKIEESLKADDDGIKTAMKAFRTDLVAGVKAGKIDATKMTADDTAVDKAIADHQAKEGAALNQLHGVLTAAERTTVVASVRAKQTEREARMATWMKAKEADGGAADFSKKRLDRLTADLTLDAGQQKQVAAILTKNPDPPNQAGMQSRWDDQKKRIDALLTAFGGDTFDATKADLQVLPGKTAHEPMDHMVTFFTQLLPILHPDQRDKLATSIDRPFGSHEGPAAAPGGARHPMDDIAFPFSEPGDNAGVSAPQPSTH